MYCHVYVISAHKRTRVVRRNMPNHHTSNYCTKGLNNKKRHCPLEIAGLYAPQGVDLGGGGSPLRKERHSTEIVACAEKKQCKVHVTTTLMCGSCIALYQVSKIKKDSMLSY